MRPMERELYLATLDSLKREPEEWADLSGFGMRLTHKRSGVQVWIGSSYCGVGIEAPGGIKIGDVTLASTFFGALIPWRAKILAAARACSKPREVANRREDKRKFRLAIDELRGIGSNP